MINTGSRIAALVRHLIVVMALSMAFVQPSLAVDPPYQGQMERLAEIMGSLYFLQPLCKAGNDDWRGQMDGLISADEPDEDRRQRLAGAFNGGYTAYARLHRLCTSSAREALTRLLVEAEKIAREMHSRYAE